MGIVTRVGVLPRAQGKGIGKLLVASLIEHARQLKLSRLVLMTSSAQLAAIRVYESHGFRRTKAMPLFPYLDFWQYLYEIDLEKKNSKG